MNIPDISQLFNQKIAEIQGRLPIKMNISESIDESFEDVLMQASSTLESAAPVIDPMLLLGNSETSHFLSPGTTKYPLVSGSYESVYPRLSQAQIQELMPRIDAAIEAYSQEYDLDPRLIRSVMKQESGFQPFALSTSGAMGLMQLMPGTAKGLGVTDAYNIEQNIKGGTQYLSYQLKAFDGDLALALAAYNAGPNAVRKYDGIPPYEQTQNYVKKVTNYYEMYKALGITK